MNNGAATSSKQPIEAAARDRFEEELDRVAQLEPDVEAWAARPSDDALREGFERLSPGPLGGWTLGVKDVIDTSNLTTERGSTIYEGRTAVADAACVALARRAGALMVGKTRTTEFALFTPTITRNPHDRTRTPGGSSSGSAAAVAAGMVRFAFGTQTVGSVIRPAAFCGVVGFKGTHAFVPMVGVAALAPSLDTLGWFTSSVADATTVYQALTDHRAAAPDAGRNEGDRPSASAPRIGVYRSHQWSSAQPELAEVLDRAAGALSDAGAEVIELEPLSGLDGLFEAADDILHYEAARVFEWERQHHWPLISPLLQRMLTRSDRVSTSDYQRAHGIVERARRHHADRLATDGIDALLTPSAPGEAPSMKTTGDSVFNREWSALGVPAVALPTGTGPTGLPVGIQLTGLRWQDDRLLAVSAWVEQALAGTLPSQK